MLWARGYSEIDGDIFGITVDKWFVEPYKGKKVLLLNFEIVTEHHLPFWSVFSPFLTGILL
ncbi:hypothetical protein [Bacillus sp. NEB1478]|uniref:hypothetical protein n=1 Tax=Bacillus sp. NEB1478 TaxID=3073816 RepID=UPI00287380A1|nr:hypothetical protein [Bacillus sp. NEB1478]WNB93726.1 hypothetical protein RGB74_08690 [Bacillus sp. NEB1478]